jgi:NAD(P)H-dependent flavin oxidoreductase YrpB (nitropropane dioxygenase family)
MSWANKHRCIPDAVVVEGPKAGGHLGFKKEDLADDLVPLDVLIRETVNAIRPFEEQFGKEVPVIAAGGIYTGYDIFDIMQAGAKGAKLGTRFVTTYECDASPAFKESFIQCKKEDITIIDSPVGLPGRAINNDFIGRIRTGQTKPFKCSWHCLSSCNFRKAPYCIAQALYNSVRGDMEEGFAFSGTNGYRATRLQHVTDVMKELVWEYEMSQKAEFLLSQRAPIVI